MEFPETVVLSISTHGIVIKDKESMTIPRGMQFAKMSWVMPTVCSFMDGDDVAACNKIIISNVLDPRRPITSENLQERCEDITKQLSGILKENVAANREVIKEVETGRDTDEFLEHRKAYVRAANRGLRVFSTLTGTKTFINKAYVRDRTEAINPNGDWQIRVLNIPGQPDVVNFIEGRAYNTRGESETDLKEIMNVLKSNGVKNVMMFDFSCANVTDEGRLDVLTSSRETRAFGRDAVHAATAGVPVQVSKLGVSLRSSSKKPKKKSKKSLELKKTAYGGKNKRQTTKRSNRR
jgi:hypothetical protein